MSSICQGKSVWPELVGATGCTAKQRIEKENSLVTAFIILDGTPVTSDFSCNRVRVFVNQYNMVARAPFIA
ncbi:hypothetical protein Leryth_019792 [Lithospermum erythrorhizon]|nr:hypothetical protein Leryth_019792 [Lithospermum erythrorhizon]